MPKMEICHAHNRRAGLRRVPKKTFGIRLSLPEGDPMRQVLGDDWHQFQWFEDETARESRIEELTGRFVYYRKGDRPTFVIERIERDNPDE
jgi:hypothetical protein